MNAKREKPKLKLPKPRGLLTRRELIGVMRQLEDYLGLDIDIEGVQRAQTMPGGQLRFSQLPGSTPATGAAAVWHNFQPQAVAGGLTISVGRINGTVPTLGGTSLNDAPVLSLSSGLNIVYLRVNFTLTIDSGFVTGFTLDSAVIEKYSTAQSNTSSARFIELFRWDDDGLVSTSQFWNIGLRAEDSGSATSTAVWVQWNA